MAKWNEGDIVAFMSNSNKYELIEIIEFKGASSSIKVKCLKDDQHKDFIVKFSNLRSNETRGRTVGCCRQCFSDSRGSYTRKNIREVREYVEKRGYELLSEHYTNQEIPLSIKCSCKNVFEMTYHNFKNGNQGCPKCGKKRMADKQRHSYEYVKNIFEERGYLLITKEYKNAFDPLETHCPIHNKTFITNFSSVRDGHGCPKCGIETRANKLRHDITYVQQYIAHNNDILLSAEYNNNLEKLLIQCKKGHTYKMAFGSYVMGHRCPICNISKGEEEIRVVLDDFHISYIHNEGYFADLLGEGGKPLRPDFILEKQRIWIEYDGIQHYEPIDFGNCDKEQVLENFEKGKRHDELKNAYAIKNNWTLLRIPYWDFDRIEEILIDKLNLEK